MDDRLGPTGPAPTKAESVQPEELPSCPTEEPAPDADSFTDHAERLQADRELRDALAAHRFAGPAYAVFEEELASYGYQVMMVLLATGHIFIRCRQAGMNLPALPIPIADREDLAQETVAQTLPAFKRKALQCRQRVKTDPQATREN